MANNKNDTDPDIDTEFDEEEFSDADFDESLEDDNEFAELSPDDVEDDFESEEWQDEEEQPAKNKKEKNLYSTGEKKGLSFNTMVIIGALVVGGGVMTFTIMNETDKVKAGQKTMFQSIMGMSGVMDGVLFGEKEDQKTEEDIIAQEKQTQTEGFLNNPNVVDANPPQPTPIAPAETEPLTPMPDIAGETPRGPDDAPSSEGVTPVPTAAVADGGQQVPVVPISPKDGMETAATEQSDIPSAQEQSAPVESAEDILKKAMANREQKTQEGPDAETAVVVPPASNPVMPEIKEPTPVPDLAVAESIIPPKAEKADDITEPVVPVTAPAVVPERVAENAKAVEALESKIDALLKRMDQIESDLGSVKDSKSSEYQQIEETVASLKQDISAIKDRPVRAEKENPVVSEESRVEVLEEDEAPKPAPKKKVKKAAVSKPASSGRWELRAAQPGRAWVSKPGDHDMQTVEVGQSLDGLGRVSAITYENGRWTVYGDRGQINQ